MTSPLANRRLRTAMGGDTKRRAIVTSAAALAALALPRLGRAQAGPKIRIGFWPVAAGLPFFVAVDRGYFKEAGLEVEPFKFAGAQQVMEAMLSGRSDGSANGTGSANLAIGEIAQPGLFKILATNPKTPSMSLRSSLCPRTAQSGRWPISRASESRRARGSRTLRSPGRCSNARTPAR